MAIDVDMGRRFYLILVTVLFFGFLSACLPFALRLSPSLFENLAASVFEECDPEIAKTAIPANLKLLEGLLKSDPTNRDILATLSMGYAGYGLLFVEPGDPERASQIYVRALDYGFEALGPLGKEIRNLEADRSAIEDALSALGKKDFKALFWATLSWTAWINLNLDKPAAFAQLPASEACLKRVLQLDAPYMHGLPHILAGVSLSARPPLFGGDPNKAKSHFQQALKLGQRRFFLAQYYFARYYAVRVQDKVLFLDLLHEIMDARPQELQDVCLINTIIQHEAGKLVRQADELFL